MTEAKRKVEFGDFQTPADLAYSVCLWLLKQGVQPKSVIEPSCGVGAFVLAAAHVFDSTKSITGYEINPDYLKSLQEQVSNSGITTEVELITSDFFATNWQSELERFSDPLLVIGNFPWVTNSVQSSLGSTNVPNKSNFQEKSGFDSISGKANFDISEWMLLEVLNWMQNRTGHVAMLAKTSVSRKILSHAERQGLNVSFSAMINIDARKEFSANVDACLLVIGINLPDQPTTHDYFVYDSLDGQLLKSVGHRDGLTIGNLEEFSRVKYLLGSSPQKWRSGVKTDASSVMEFTATAGGLINGLGEIVDLEEDYLYPLLKGSDIGTVKSRQPKFILVTQKKVGEDTSNICNVAPKTWQYLNTHADKLDGRGSVIYKKAPRFGVFGVGDYSYKPWKIAICGLYKKLTFKLIGPTSGKPTMFDDTVYFLSFDSEHEARNALIRITADDSLSFLDSLIFWDEKRPIKTAILNLLDWERIELPANFVVKGNGPDEREYRASDNDSWATEVKSS
jgi:hypothetical protein